MDVEYPGSGAIVVSGRRFDHDVVICDGIVSARDKEPSRARSTGGHTPLTAAEDLPWTQPRLVIGSGHSGRLPIDDDVYAEAESRGVELIVLPTAEACEVLRDIGPDQANAVLHVTC